LVVAVPAWRHLHHTARRDDDEFVPSMPACSLALSTLPTREPAGMHRAAPRGTSCSCMLRHCPAWHDRLPTANIPGVQMDTYCVYPDMHT
jgi:hypothetical protein